jgi:hypothetical protein
VKSLSRFALLVAPFLVAAALVAPLLRAQERKPVPKDSARVFVPGCSKGYVFTAGTRTEDQPGGTVVPEGVHLRMNGPKKLISEIKGQEGSRIEITGLVKRGQFLDGVNVGGGVRISGGPAPNGGGASVGANIGGGQIAIDVEGWRRISGDCPGH